MQEEREMKRRILAIFSGLFLGLALATILNGAESSGRHDHAHAVADELEFLVEMIPHHQEAVDSASVILKAGKRKELRSFAKEIMQVQAREIAMMKQWLVQWYPEHEKQASYKPMMRQLKGLPPDRAETVFLEDMIEHHRAAVKMAQEVLDKGLARHDEVDALARQILATQTQEITRMQQWLEAWRKDTPTAPAKRHGH
jgi:uncharacterized protein (DUF305 family)